MKKVILLVLILGVGGCASIPVAKLKQRCDNNHGRSCTSLGYDYRQGENGVKRDYIKSLAYLKKACRLGDDFGCDLVGSAYHFGRGVRIDYIRALAYYQKACDLGDSSSCKYDGLWLLKKQNRERLRKYL